MANILSPLGGMAVNEAWRAPSLPRKLTIWIKTKGTITFPILLLQPFGGFQSRQSGGSLSRHASPASNARRPIVERKHLPTQALIEKRQRENLVIYQVTTGVGGKRGGISHLGA